MKVAIIGAGASGLMCAGFIKKAGHEVHVFDGNEKVGKKLYITGKGRCNFTNASVGDDFSENVVRGEKFLRSALSNWNSFDTIDFFENLGVKTKIERGNRAFPQSDKASDITKALLKHCEGVNFHCNEKVFTAQKDGEVFKLKTEKGWANAGVVNSFSFGDIDVTLTGDSGDTKYYDSGSNLRIYIKKNGGTGSVAFSAKAGYKIVSVKITYVWNKSTGTFTLKNNEVGAVDAASVSYAIGNPGGENEQLRITAFEIVYVAA